MESVRCHELPKEKEAGWSPLVGHNHVVASSHLTYNIQRHLRGVSAFKLCIRPAIEKVCVSLFLFLHL